MTLEHAIDSLKHYAATGRPMGGFLTAVVENDLMAAVGYADDSSLDNLQAIVMHITWEIPAVCWGSKVKVAVWQAAKMKEREARA